MGFGDFEWSLAASALAVLLIALFDSEGAISPLFAASLFALCLVGFYALQELLGAGMSSQKAQYIFISAVLASFLASILSFMNFSEAYRLALLPLVFCAPAIGTLARGFFSSG